MPHIPLVSIWCDGSCWPNPGPGAWSAVVVEDGVQREMSGRWSEDTTNNRMELTAAILALRSLQFASHVDLYTDSQYLQKGATLWINGWSKKNWKGVKNLDLWKAISALQFKHDICWYWVRGHADCPENCRADALAENARLDCHPKALANA